MGSTLVHSPEHGTNHSPAWWAALARLAGPSRLTGTCLSMYALKLFAQPQPLPQSFSGEVGYGPGEPFSCSTPFRLQQEPHPPSSPASCKPGETNTVTPSWQVPLGAIQFPRETSPHKAHVPSCPATGNQTMPITLATTAVPSPWFVTTTATVQLTERKRVALPLLYKLPLIIRKRGKRGAAELGKGRIGVSVAVQEAPSVCMFCSWFERTVQGSVQGP